MTQRTFTPVNRPLRITLFIGFQPRSKAAGSNRLTIAGAQHVCRQLAQRLGIPAVHPHQLRHTLGTLLQMSRIASGASFDKIRERLLPATSPFELDQGRLVEASSHAS
jgi:integrase